MFSQRARRASLILVASVVATIVTTSSASASGLFPDDPVDPNILGGFNNLFDNAFTAACTIITMLAGLFFLWYAFKVMKARTVDQRQNYAISALLALVILGIAGSVGDVFSVAGDIGRSLFG